MSKILDVSFIPENFYQLRKNILRMSQEKFAELVDISSDTVSNIERGKYLPNISTLINVANKTEIPLEFFFEEMEKKQ